MSTLEHMKLGLLGPAAAWAFTCLLRVCLLFICVEPSIEHLCGLYIDGEWQRFVGASNSFPIDVIICCLGYVVLCRKICALGGCWHHITDLFLVFCGDPLIVNDEHGATARVWSGGCNRVIVIHDCLDAVSISTLSCEGGGEVVRWAVVILVGLDPLYFYIATVIREFCAECMYG